MLLLLLCCHDFCLASVFSHGTSCRFPSGCSLHLCLIVCFLSSATCSVFSVWWTGATAGARMSGRAHACLLVARSVLCFVVYTIGLVLRAFPWALVIGVGGCDFR